MDLLANPKLRRTSQAAAATGPATHATQDQAAGTQERQVRDIDRSQRKPKAWVAVQLLDQSGNPAANERYHLVLPDGTVMDGSLNDSGEVWIGEIDPGQCRISFPDIDSKEWTAA